MGRSIGIKRVAEAAGVSTTTVSDALNGKGRLPKETRERVKETARRLGYRPNANARNLAGGRTGLLAMSVSQPRGLSLQLGDFDYYAQLMHSATEFAIDHGYALLVAPVIGAEETLGRIPLDGAIVVDPIEDDPVITRLRTDGTPFVTSGRETGRPEDACWIDHDHDAGIRKVLDHMRERGAERVALVTAPPVQSYLQDALRSYEEWCSENGQEVKVATVTEGLTEGGGYAAAWELLNGPDPPDAIYASLDRLALGALLAADARGASVPGDLMVAGCTDSGASRAANPPLTALSMNPDAIGRAAAELLIALVEDREPGERQRIIPTQLLARESTGGSKVRTDERAAR